MTRGDATVFPLVPRHRLIGLAFGAVGSVRRGRGFDVAGTRGYLPGDPVQAIDWKASARLATARGSDEFVVLERYAEEAPRAVIVCDRRPAMALYPEDSPWLAKPAAVHAVAELIARSTAAAHGLLGYVDLAGGEGVTHPPRNAARLDEIDERLRGAPFDAPADNVQTALARVRDLGRDLPAGSFVFVVSDFLEPPPADVWSRAAARRWELVPVVVQDPVWEQDFPAIANVVVPVTDPASGRRLLVRLGARDVAARGEENRRRRARLLAELDAQALTPVLVSSSDPEHVLRAFLDWSERRAASDGRVW